MQSCWVKIIICLYNFITGADDVGLESTSRTAKNVWGLAVPARRHARRPPLSHNGLSAWFLPQSVIIFFCHHSSKKLNLLILIFSISFISRSTEEVFNPRPFNPSLLCHSLIELLSIVSPAFKRNFALVQKRRMQKHPFERVATPYQVYQWASPMLDHTVDAIRAEDSKWFTFYSLNF